MIWLLVYVVAAGIVTAGRHRRVYGPSPLGVWFLAFCLGWIVLPVAALIWLDDKLGDF